MKLYVICYCCESCTFILPPGRYYKNARNQGSDQDILHYLEQSMRIRMNQQERAPGMEPGMLVGQNIIMLASSSPTIKPGEFGLPQSGLSG